MMLAQVNSIAFRLSVFPSIGMQLLLFQGLL